MKFKEYSQLNLSDINKEMLAHWSDADIFNNKNIFKENNKPV